MRVGRQGLMKPWRAARKLSTDMSRSRQQRALKPSDNRERAEAFAERAVSISAIPRSRQVAERMDPRSWGDQGVGGAATGGKCAQNADCALEI